MSQWGRFSMAHFLEGVRENCPIGSGVNTMKKTLSIVLVLLICFSTLLSAGATTVSLKSPDKKMGLISSLVVQLLAKEHYTKRKLDADYSAEVFDEYLRFLDPTHIFFLQDDIDAFAKSKNELAQGLPAFPASRLKCAYSFASREVLKPLCNFLGLSTLAAAVNAFKCYE